MAAGGTALTPLAGRTALVTGATGSLGRAVAEAYGRAGASLLLTGREEAPLQTFARELARTYSADVAAVACDLANPGEIERLRDEVLARFGGLDVLVNVAAVIGPIGPTWEIAWDEWRDSFDVNLFATAHLCHVCVPLMPLRAGRGKIINLSGGGAAAPRPRLSAYATAKTGVVRFTETLAQEIRERRIDANCIAPGILNSKLTRAIVAAGPERAGRREYEAALRAVTEETGNRERAAELALFLASPQSDGISGRLISALWDDWPGLRAESPALQSPDTYALRRVLPQTTLADPVVRPARDSLNVCVAGLWHLGCVTAAAVAAAGHHVMAFDSDSTLIDDLRAARPPVHEPGLVELLQEGIETGRLTFTTDPVVVRDADVIWVTWDTPIDAYDYSDATWIFKQIEGLFPHLRDDSLMLVSSQLPAGSIAMLERRFAEVCPDRTAAFACVPENLRLGQALDAFTRRQPMVVGIREAAPRERIVTLLAPFVDHIEWMSIESAEMSKHAINAFLAASVTFINEIAELCEEVGADAAEVSRGLKLDRRIGPDAYVSPGAAFSGGTLARDVVALTALAAEHGLTLNVIPSIRVSNDRHGRWAAVRLQQELGTLAGRTIAVWGLAYKAGTDTLRRSGALDLCEILLGQGAVVRVYDPAVSKLPASLNGRLSLAEEPVTAADGADALIIATDWPHFRAIEASQLVGPGRQLLVLDANGFLADTLGRSPHVRYLRVGRL